MDINKIIAANLTAWMASNPALDTVQKVESASGIGFGTVRRAKKGEGNITAKNMALLAAAISAPALAAPHRIDTAARTAMTETGARGLAIALVERGRVTRLTHDAVGACRIDGPQDRSDIVRVGQLIEQRVVGEATVRDVGNIHGRLGGDEVQRSDDRHFVCS